MSELKATRIKMVYNGEVYEDFGTVPCMQLYYRKEERRWRKCSEGLPSAKQRVLFLAKYKTDKVREWIGDFRHVDGMKEDFAVFYASAPGWGCEFLIDEVIGWMPLPSAPKEER